MRDRLRALLPRLHVLPALSGRLDQWAEWLVRTRFACLSEQETAEAFAQLGQVRDRVLDGARLEPGRFVADVGAGTGLLALAAAERVAPDGEVLAIDVSADALEELRRVCESPNVAYLIGGAEALPLPDASVHAVVTRSVLIYVRDKAAAAREFFRVLRPHGRVSLFEPINRRNRRLTELVDFGALAPRVAEWEQALLERDDPMLDFDDTDLVAQFESAGFVGVEHELRELPQTMRPERLLTAVGAPGRRSLAGEWADAFGPAVAERLAEAVRTGGPVTAVWSGLFLVAAKP